MAIRKTKKQPEIYIKKTFYFFMPTDLKKLIKVWPVPYRWIIDFKHINL